MTETTKAKAAPRARAAAKVTPAPAADTTAVPAGRAPGKTAKAQSDRCAAVTSTGLANAQCELKAGHPALHEVHFGNSGHITWSGL